MLSRVEIGLDTSLYRKASKEHQAKCSSIESIYSPMHKKTEKSISRFFIYKKFKKQFYFFTCILPGYVFNESPKEFWKNSNFENMRANFISRCQNSLRQNSPEIMHFQAIL